MPCPCNRLDHEVGQYARYVRFLATTPLSHSAPCLDGWRDVVSVASGGASIVIWAIVLAPRLYYSWVYQQALGGGTFMVVGNWANLAGTYLTDQLPTQFYLAILFCSVDLLTWLMVWYISMYPETPRRFASPNGTMTNVVAANLAAFWQNRSEKDLDRFTVNTRFGGHFDSYVPEPTSTFDATSGASANSYQRSPPASSSGLGGSSCILCIIVISLVGEVSAQSNVAECPKKIDPARWSYIVGCLVSWLSAAAYMVSRMPFIYQNCKFKSYSVARPNAWLFFLSFLGYATYSISIVFRIDNPEWRRGAFYQSRFPYLVGSITPMMADLVILLQSMYYPLDDYPEPARAGYDWSAWSSGSPHWSNGADIISNSPLRQFWSGASPVSPRSGGSPSDVNIPVQRVPRTM